MFELKNDGANDIKEEELGIESGSTFNKDLFRQLFFLRTLNKMFPFRKRKKPMKHNVVRTIIFYSPP